MLPSHLKHHFAEKAGLLVSVVCCNVEAAKKPKDFISSRETTTELLNFYNIKAISEINLLYI